MIEVRWQNIILLALVVLTIMIVLKNYDSICVFLLSMGNIGSTGASQEDNLRELIAFGLVAFLLLGIIRILLRSQK